MTLRDELIEEAAREIDPVAWADDLPIPTRDHTIAFHTNRAKSVAQAKAALDAILTRLRGELPEEMVEAGEMACAVNADFSLEAPQTIFHAMLGVLEEKG